MSGGRVSRSHVRGQGIQVPCQGVGYPRLMSGGRVSRSHVRDRVSRSHVLGVGYPVSCQGVECPGSPSHETWVSYNDSAALVHKSMRVRNDDVMQ